VSRHSVPSKENRPRKAGRSIEIKTSHPTFFFFFFLSHECFSSLRIFFPLLDRESLHLQLSFLPTCSSYRGCTLVLPTMSYRFDSQINEERSTCAPTWTWGAATRGILYTMLVLFAKERHEPHFSSLGALVLRFQMWRGCGACFNYYSIVTKWAHPHHLTQSPCFSLFGHAAFTS
jgi:hypothetical protein